MSKKKELKVVKKKEVAVRGADTSVDTLISKALDKDTPVEVYEKLMAMRRELRAEKAKELFDANMAGFQGECPVIEKDKKGAETNSGIVAYSYAQLALIVLKTRELREKYGFSFIIKSETKQAAIKAIIIIKHKGGHSETTDIEVPLITKTGVMSGAQVVIGTINLAKRHALCNGFGIMTADMDNDIVAASQSGITGKINAAKQNSQKAPLEAEITPSADNEAKRREERAERKDSPLPDNKSGVSPASFAKQKELAEICKGLPGTAAQRTEVYGLLKTQLRLDKIADDALSTKQANDLIAIVMKNLPKEEKDYKPENEEFDTGPVETESGKEPESPAKTVKPGCCVECEKKVGKASAALSVKKYAVILCPTCQKKRGKR